MPSKLPGNADEKDLKNSSSLEEGDDGRFRIRRGTRTETTTVGDSRS